MKCRPYYLNVIFTRDDSQQQFLAQEIVAKDRRCETSRVLSPLQR